MRSARIAVTVWLALAIVAGPELARVAAQQWRFRADPTAVMVAQAPDTTTYIIPTPDAALANAQPISLLADGLLAANTRYAIDCVIRYDANATTTGVGFGWTGPASPALTSAQMRSGLTSATIGGTTINGNDTGGVTTASVATTANVATFEGLWSNGANAGTIQMRLKSEVAIANAIIAKAGYWCRSSIY